jgi:hypothetical protein
VGAVHVPESPQIPLIPRLTHLLQTPQITYLNGGFFPDIFSEFLPVPAPVPKIGVGQDSDGGPKAPGPTGQADL